MRFQLQFALVFCNKQFLFRKPSIRNMSSSNQKPSQPTGQPGQLSFITKSGGFEKVKKPIPKDYTSIVEGTATILHTKENQVFYNNVQIFNRDLSVLAIKMFDQLRRAEHQQHEGFLIGSLD
jgi:hypothetical protein